MCARNKAFHQPPVGLLKPLPIPTRPWSHIAIDFVTGLPVSKGNTVILMVVDRFSKAVSHFIPLPIFPSAKTMSQILVIIVIRLFYISPFNNLKDALKRCEIQSYKFKEELVMSGEVDG